MSESNGTLEAAYNAAAQRVAQRLDVPLTRTIKLSNTLQNDFFVSRTHETIVLNDRVPGSRLADVLHDAVMQAYRVDHEPARMTRAEALNYALSHLSRLTTQGEQACDLIEEMLEELHFKQDTAS